MPPDAPPRDALRPVGVTVSVCAAAVILVCLWAVLASPPVDEGPDPNGNRRIFAFILMVPGALALVLAMPWALPRSWRKVTVPVSLTILGLVVLLVVAANLFAP